MSEQSVNRQLAALDLGSNSFHLIVAKDMGDYVQVVDKYKEMVRLAEGMDANGELSEKAERRALDCLERLGERLRGIDPKNVRVVGTNALRKADNAQQFLTQAESILGHEVEIISGREEARLIYLGVSHNLEDTLDRRLVVDIGGGSTELIVGRNFQPVEMESLYMGCVSMSDRCFPGGSFSNSAFNKALNLAKMELEPVCAQFSRANWDTAIGASGTVVAIQQIMNREPATSGVVTADGLNELWKTLRSAKHINDLDLPHLAAERKPVFAGGVAILKAIFEELEVEQMHASGGALREGLIQDLLGRVHRHDVRHATVADFQGRYRIDVPHAEQVRELAMQLYAQVALDWRLTDTEHQLLLRWAADLHEIGMDVAHSQYHKHGGYLLQHMDMPGFSQAYQKRLATLVRAHRRKVPVEFFSGEDQKPLLRLAVILRLAIVLRRSRHRNPLPHIALKANGDKITVSLPRDWLDKHPLTRLDLQQEADYLQSVSMKLVVEESKA